MKIFIDMNEKIKVDEEQIASMKITEIFLQIVFALHILKTKYQPKVGDFNDSSKEKDFQVISLYEACHKFIHEMWYIYHVLLCVKSHIERKTKFLKEV